MKPLKTINEAAELLSVSPWSIRKWIKKGRLQPVRICRRVHLEEAEIERFVAEAKTNRPGLSNPISGVREETCQIK